MMFKLQGMLWPYVPVLLKEIYNAGKKCWDDFPNWTWNTSLPPCNVVMLLCFMHSLNVISVAVIHCLGKGSFQTFAMKAPPCLRRLVIDVQNTNVHCKRYFHIYPCQKMLARIVGTRLMLPFVRKKCLTLIIFVVKALWLLARLTGLAVINLITEAGTTLGK